MILLHILYALYMFCLFCLTLYCLMQLHLLWHYLYDRFFRPCSKKTASLLPEEFPFVTVQLPLYNEMYVAKRLVDNIVRLDYPKDRLQFQILDDSTDETTDILSRCVAFYRNQGFDMLHLRRSNRFGFKAGALQEGLSLAKGDLIAIFDADFLPQPDFLKKLIPYFTIEKTGVVQARWEHLNENFSLLTRLQALQLNVHFSVEQRGRYAGGCWLQFNGTAGIWLKKAIEDAGGWQADTLTEDLDLSIRAQMKGWKIVYVEEVGVPAELPAEMNGIKSQQFRWTKGGAETARKMLVSVWNSSASTGQKIHATFQLGSSTMYVFLFALGVLSIPVFVFLENLQLSWRPLHGSILGLSAITLVYLTGNTQPSGFRSVLRFFLLFPVFLSFSMGLSFHNAIAVAEGWLGRQSAFVRTPKFNIKSHRADVHNKGYARAAITAGTLAEGFFALIFSVMVWYALRTKNYSFLYLHSSMGLGFAAVFFYTLKNSLVFRRGRSPQMPVG